VKENDTKIVQGVTLLKKDIPDYNRPKNDRVNFYYWYFGTRAMNLAGGEKDAKKWNGAVRKALTEKQCSGEKCDAGSWDPIGEWGIVGGRVYATAIAAMTLREVLEGENRKP
jgi:hypothetical protein